METVAIMLGVLISFFLIILLYSQYRLNHVPVPERIQSQPGRFEDIVKRIMVAKGLGPGQPGQPRTSVDGALENKGAVVRWNTEMHDAEPEQRSSEEIQDKRVLLGAAAVDGLIPSVDVWTKLLSIDESVFQAMSHLTHTQIEGFSDLLKVVDAKGYAIDTQGFFNNLMGHVGEWHVADDFVQAGHAVSMPWDSNHPGLDMWVDGHAVNVKTVADASTTALHFENYPDIAPVIPHDAVNIPSDALYFDPTHGIDTSLLEAAGHHTTIVDSALSHADVANQTHDAIDALHGPAVHFPVVTMAVSSFREGRLLWKGHTDMARAAKNVAVDTGAVGGGGAVGLKAGAIIGSIFGPLGTFIGGGIGAVGGALGGRYFANKIKQQPLIEAKTVYDKALRKYQKVEAEAAAYVSKEWQEAQAQEGAKLKDALNALKTSQEKEAEQIRAQLSADLTISSSQAQKLISQANEQIAAMVINAERELRANLKGPEKLFPALMAPEATAKFRVLRRDAKAWKRQAEEVMREWEASPKWVVRLFNLLLAIPMQERNAEEYVYMTLTKRGDRYVSLRSNYEHFLAVAVSLRKMAADNLKISWGRIETTAEEMLSGPIAILKSVSKEFKSELRKAGMEAR